MIEIKDINKSFGDTQVLHDISIGFNKGEINLIIGASGSGKSVLTKCIVGLHEVDSGTVEEADSMLTGIFLSGIEGLEELNS